jgi:hypothetical protein
MTSPKGPTRNIALQPRDLALIRDLFESRIMTAGHISVFHFSGGKETAKKRLQKLKTAGLISERARLVNEPAILFLTRKGLGTLRDQGVLADYPALDLPVLERRTQVSRLTIRHELDVMDVRAALHTAVTKSTALSIAEFCTWPRLHQFETDVLVKPDGFVRIQEPDRGISEHTFFVEVDRSSESLDTLVSRIGAYVEYYKSGGFAENNGAPRSAYKDYPFRVLVVFKTAERRNNMAERLLQNTPPIFTQVYLATFADATTEPLGPIWIRPIDYQSATKATPFAVESNRTQWGYQRQTARESFVESNVKKQRLLVEEFER